MSFSMEKEEKVGLSSKLHRSKSEELWLLEEIGRNPDAADQHLGKLKKNCRMGIPNEYRKNIWLVTSGGISLRQKNQTLYMSSLAEVFSNCSIEDIPVIPYFGQEEEVIKRLQKAVSADNWKLDKKKITSQHRLLEIVQRMHFDVTTCPIIVEIVAFCLNFMEEEDAFYVVHSLIKRSKTQQNRVFPLSEVEVAICSDTSLQLFKKNFEDLYKVLEPYSQDVRLFLEKWFSGKILHLFDREYFLRFFDILFLEGIKILYRISLAILKLFAHEISSVKGIISEEKIERWLLGHTPTADELLKLSFKIHLTRKEIFSFEDSIRVMYRSGKRRSSISQRSSPVASTSRHKRASSYTESRMIALTWPDFDSSESKIFTRKEIFTLWSWIPPNFHSESSGKVFKIFSTAVDGYSFKSIVSKVRNKGPFIFVVQSTHTESSPEQVFGFFSSQNLIETNKPTSDSEMFLFQRTTKDTIPRLEAYFPKLDNTQVEIKQDLATLPIAMFILSPHRIAVTGRDGRAALYFNKSLQEGTSDTSDTFLSPSFSIIPDQTFQVSTIEVWSIGVEFQETLKDVGH